MQRMSFPFNNTTTPSEVLSGREKSLGRLQYCLIHAKRMNHQLMRYFPTDAALFCSSCTRTHTKTHAHTLMYVLVCDSFRLLPTAAVWYFKVGVIMLSWNRGSPRGGLWAAYLHTG